MVSASSYFRLHPGQLHICLVLLMEEILHQLIGISSHYLQGFIHPRWCPISSINSSSTVLYIWLPTETRTHLPAKQYSIYQPQMLPEKKEYGFLPRSQLTLVLLGKGLVPRGLTLKNRGQFGSRPHEKVKNGHMNKRKWEVNIPVPWSIWELYDCNTIA